MSPRLLPSHQTVPMFTPSSLNPLCAAPECTFIVLDKQRWADASVEEEECMVGDVNIFLTDPTEPSWAELEVMIAGNNPFPLIPIHLCTSWSCFSFLQPSFVRS